MKPRIFALFSLVFLCGCPLSTIDKAKVTLTVIDKTSVVAMAELTNYDKAKQQKIVDDGKAAGKTAEAIQLEINVYRVERDKVVDGFLQAMLIVDKGHKLIPLVQSGVNKETDLAVWIPEAIAAIQAILEVLKGFGVNIPFAIPGGV